MSELQAETWVSERAERVLSGEILASFLALPLKDRLIGIATFAHIGGDTEMRDAALEIAKHF